MEGVRSVSRFRWFFIFILHMDVVVPAPFVKNTILSLSKGFFSLAVTRFTSLKCVLCADFPESFRKTKLFSSRFTHCV